ncbi:hypothetical protein K493DRAFT_295142 [Basidiobolus meristosporus CBS 931.73]|uniref:Xylanolytic transcriptional activator regulatory domain-containing protein n=1 Tax=Basidiobolus meristosporus CBS 931.73 TaxID=1314790 RepID=A0A1Y1ZCV5_9FUNG|nr:hypothetical protein K493DRAFT_295142 [Basidiobolus meristosporus CBS 931.73]|eukprot:ORY08122.1 hypothetical protein K493DRAFT_295142 [Basidiobolus meristosporus CBS 931.73]
MDGGKIFEVTSSQASEGMEENGGLTDDQFIRTCNPSNGFPIPDNPSLLSETEHDTDMQNPISLLSSPDSSSTTQLTPSPYSPSEFSYSDGALTNADSESMLISAFFDHIYIHIPIIHKTNFLMNYHQGSVHRLLLSSVCALASRYVEENPDSTHSQYFEDNILSSCDDASIEVLQSLLIMSLYEISCGRQNRSYIYIGIAIRLSQLMKIHRMDEYSNYSENMDSANVDHILSAEGKYPVTVNIADVALSLPVECSNWENGMPAQNPRLKLINGLPVFSVEDEFQLNQFSSLITLSIIFARVNKYYDEVDLLSEEMQLREFSVLSTAVENWETFLPQDLRLTPEKHTQKSDAYLFSSFIISLKHAVTIKLLSTKMRVPGQEMAYNVKSQYFGPALRESFVAAKYILAVVNGIKEVPPIRIHPFFGCSVYSAAVFYLHGARSKNSEQSQRSLTCFKFLVRVLRHLSLLWKNCGNYCNLLLETLRLLKRKVAHTEFTRMGGGNPLKDLTPISMPQDGDSQPSSRPLSSETSIDEVITEVITRSPDSSAYQNQRKRS